MWPHWLLLAKGEDEDEILRSCFPQPRAFFFHSFVISHVAFGNFGPVEEEEEEKKKVDGDHTRSPPQE